MALLKRIPAWSFSRWITYTKCPAQAKFKFIDKLKEPDSPAFAKGNAVHKDAELYLKGEKRALPPSLRSLEAEFKALKKLKPMCEVQWGFDSNWAPTGWFDADAWVRVMADAVCSPEKGVLKIIDFKTGKKYHYHINQLSLYALAAFNKFLDIHKVSAELWYMDTGEIDTIEFHRSEEKSLTVRWKKDTAKMMKDAKFTPTPSADACKYCHFKKASGGPCKY